MGLVQLFGISLPAFFVQSNHGPYIHDLAIPATWRGFVARISPTTGWVLVACRERVLGERPSSIRSLLDSVGNSGSRLVDMARLAAACKCFSSSFKINRESCNAIAYHLFLLQWCN